MKPIQEYCDVDAARFRDTILPLNQPAVLKGVANRWPAVVAGQASPQMFCDYIRRFDNGSSVVTYVTGPEANGRFWYRPDMRGLNFDKVTEPLGIALDRILAQLEQARPMAVYAGSVPVPTNLPGFARENSLDLVDASAIPRIWIGNNVIVSTHNDLSDNLACVVAGRRRFTLFPPEQVTNLYIGPLEFNFAGQPVSMVSLKEPDFERYPLFRDALAAAQCAELGPGDAIYIPYMWWHHVESLEPFNALVNYWWDGGRSWLASPFEAMILGLLAIGDLPPEKRRIWKTFFDHYVFRPDGRHPAEHLASEHRGVMSVPTPELARYIKSWLVKVLSL